MKNVLTIITFISLTWYVNAQISLSGLITDAEESPLPNANVLVYSIPDTLFVHGTISDDEGKYLVVVKIGMAGFLEIRSIGYKSIRMPLTEGRTNYPAQLMPQAQNIDEVVVTAQKPVFEKQADRLVVNVESNISSLGGTSLELLEKSPGVSVNRATSEIALNGKQGVLIMIDNKIRRVPADVLINLLNSISLNEVEKIELITNPSARYEASGTGGIIHLVTRGNATDGWSGQVGGSTVFYYKPGATLNGSVTWHKGKFNSFASYSVSIDRRKELWAQNIRKPLAGYDFFSDSRIDRFPDTWLHNVSLGFQYQLSPKTSVETLLTGYRRNYNQTGTNTGQFQAEFASIQSFESLLHEDNIRNMGTIFTRLTHKFDEDHKLSLSIEYVGNKQDQPSSYGNNFDSGESEILEATKSTPLHIWIGQLDYDWALFSGFNLAAGVKYSLSRFDNDVEILTKRGNEIERDDELSLLSELNERIFSAYVSSQWQVRENWKLRAGLRLESADTKLIEDRLTSVVDRQEVHFFPNLVSEITISDRSRISLSYGRRIARPSFSDLSPFVFYPNPVTLFYGDPALLPGVGHHIDLNYSFGEYWVTLGFAAEKDKIVSFQPGYDMEQRLMVYRPQNLDHSQDYRLQIGFPIRPAKWLDYNNSITLRTTRFRVNEPQEIMSIPGLDYQGSLSLSLPQDFSIGLNGIFFVNANFGIGSLEPYGKLDIGLRKKFTSINGTLGFTFSDVLDSYLWNFRVHDETKAGFKADLDYTFGMRGIRISYSMPLGNSQIKKKDIDTGSQEVKGRIN